MSRKQIIHQYITESNISKLRDYVDKGQLSLLAFDDPSLLDLAIQVYLDPKCIQNQEYQMDMIIFLFKTGIRFNPNGSLLLYFHSFIKSNSDSDPNISVKQNMIIQSQLIALVDTIIQQGKGDLLKNEDQGLYPMVSNYINRSWSAILIQRAWRRYKNF